MRRYLDIIYYSAGVLACLFLIAIALVTLFTITGRVFGFALYSADEFAGWAMAASTFLGLAATLRAKEHIRVSLLIDRLANGHRAYVEILCLIVSTIFMGFFTWYAITAVYQAYIFGEVSQGMTPVLLWIPQSSMAVGALLMFIALAEDLITSLRGGKPSHLVATPTSPPEST